MATVLIIGGAKGARELTAAALRSAGHRILVASRGAEALEMLGGQRPDLVLLETTLPDMDDLEFLRRLRSYPRAAKTPVVMLTAKASKEHVLAGARLGVRGYILKSCLSMPEIVSRIGAYLAGLSGQAPKPAPPAAAAPPLPVAAVPVPTEIPHLLSRQDCLSRAERAMEAKTLSGVVAQVVSMAGSPRVDMSQLASLISRDAMLSARVLQTANSAAYRSSRGVITTIPEAIRNVGCTTVRNIAAALGIFEAMPETSIDGFNPIRCWQHSFAVARLCEQLYTKVDPEAGGTAYLMGLCHDLGEILFHTQFGSEFRQVVELQARTGKSRDELERTMLGMSHGELVMTILQRIGLPETIRDPVEALHRSIPPKKANEKMARALRLAEQYANGALLASSVASAITPIKRDACRAAVEADDPASPDIEPLRNEIFCLTAMLSRLDNPELMKPLCEASGVRVWLARDPAFSAFDPVQAALSSLAQVQAHERLPGENELKDCDALVVVSAASTTAGFSGPEVLKALAAGGKAPVPALHLTADGTATAAGVEARTFPLPLSQLDCFVRHAATATRKSVAA